MLDSEVETLLSGLDYVEDAANRLEEQRNSAQNQHSNVRSPQILLDASAACAELVAVDAGRGGGSL